MPIKVSSPTPVKKSLPIDPDGDSWVMVKPITYRDDLLRGELLKDTRMDSTGTRVTVNKYALRAEEIWLTYDRCHIVLVDADGDKSEPFKPKDEMTRAEFMEILCNLPPDIVLDWHQMVIAVNPGWTFPF